MYSVRLLAAVYDERKVLPGNVRQRMKNLIESLAQAPRPHNSIELNLEGVVSEIVNGKRGISKAQAKILGEFFHVSPELFI